MNSLNLATEPGRLGGAATWTLKLAGMDLWEKIVPPFKYDKEVPFFEMLVPTIDTVRFGYLLEKFLAVRYSVLYTGGPGVGKVWYFILR